MTDNVPAPLSGATSAELEVLKEGFKFGREVVDLLKRSGAYVTDVLGDVPRDVVGYYGGDYLHEQRRLNAAKLRQETDDELRRRGIGPDRPAPSMMVAVPLIETAVNENREELLKLWSMLLANLIDPKGPKVRQAFIETVRHLEPLDAHLLEKLYTAQVHPPDWVNITGCRGRCALVRTRWKSLSTTLSGSIACHSGAIMPLVMPWAC